MPNLPMQYPDHQLYSQQSFDYITLPQPEQNQEKSFVDYLNIIRKRKWTFLLPAILCFPLIAIYISGKKPVYEAQATVLIEKKSKQDDIIPIIQVGRGDASSEYHRTQHEIIKSRTVAEKVVDALQLHKKPPEETPYLEKKIANLQNTISRALNAAVNLFASKQSVPPASPAGPIHPGNPEERSRQLAIARLKNSLDVEPREGSQVVDIRLRRYNPVDAAQQVNMVAQTFVRQNLENKLHESRKAIAWLRKRAKELNTKITNAESSIQEFKERKQIVAYGDVNQTNDMSMEQIGSLQTSYIKVNSERNDLKVRLDEIEKISKKDIDRMIGSSSVLIDSDAISSLRTEYIRLSNEYQKLSKIFKSKHPKLSRIRDKLQEIKDSIYYEIQNFVTTMRKQYAILESKEREIIKQLGQQRSKFIKSSNDIVTFAKLNNDLDIDKDLYLTVSKRLAETTLTEALETNNIKVLELASVPAFPTSASKVRGLMISLVAMLGLGAGLAIFLESLDKRFKSADEVEQYLGINFLGLVPSHKTAQNKPITLHDPCTSAAEAFRTLRTWMPISSFGDAKALMITSALPGEGKSTTAANLAISFAQLGHIVVLIDTDLRRPKLHHTFNMTQNSGLVDVLAHGAHWQSVLQDTEMENLKVILTGGRPHNPAELLSTRRLQDLLADLKQTFDIVIVDAPVALTIPDVAILAPEMDGVLLVHDPSKGNKEVVLETKRVLDRAGAHLLGMIFNN
ncbi:MAG: polysaccharide biosynthesis tyrosine autokinase, partial [Candidatus Tectomicrobia bacterium]|nr:polysaccharide biosynthesis tyrosine autokinase [Candidatus Tectomicrobia bacterium]